LVIASSGASPSTAALPPGRQYVLTIDGENTVTFIPQTGLTPHKIDYRARVEYIVNNRTGEDAAGKGDGTTKKKAVRKSTVAAKSKRKEGDQPASKVASSVELSIHASEMRVRQNGQPVVESRISRTRFQGRIQPEAPVISVSASEAPPRLQELLKTFDTPAASLLLNENSQVVDRRVRSDGPQRALIETLLSIHTPIPSDVAFWEAPTQLAMGHGQTAKGKLRFEKQKESLGETGGLVKVKITGDLKAEGIVVGRLIKDGTYSVTGEQTYDTSTHEWTSAHWSVDINNELANPGGRSVAHARGTMLVESTLHTDASAASSAPSK
jgi:hypothetical protein